MVAELSPSLAPAHRQQKARPAPLTTSLTTACPVPPGPGSSESLAFGNCLRERRVDLALCTCASSADRGTGFWWKTAFRNQLIITRSRAIDRRNCRYLLLEVRLRGLLVSALTFKKP